MARIEISDADGSCETIECTAGHPFWVMHGIALEERAEAEEAIPPTVEPTIGGRWAEAGSLRAGDVLLTGKGEMAVVSGVTLQRKPRVVYNLTLAEVHTYAVGDDGVLVHNACPIKKYPKLAGKDHYHHIDPKYMGGAKNGKKVKIDAEYHQNITNAFREKHPYGGGKLPESERRRIMEEVYRDFPIPGWP